MPIVPRKNGIQTRQFLKDAKVDVFHKNGKRLTVQEDGAYEYVVCWREELCVKRTVPLTRLWHAEPGKHL